MQDKRYSSDMASDSKGITKQENYCGSSKESLHLGEQAGQDSHHKVILPTA